MANTSNNTVANSEAVGVGLVTTKAGQVVIGKYNATSDADIVIGCGTDEANRKNALTIKDGVVSSDSITESVTTVPLNFSYDHIPEGYVEDMITIGKGTDFTYAAFIPMDIGYTEGTTSYQIYQMMTEGSIINGMRGCTKLNPQGYSAQTYKVGVGMVSGSDMSLGVVNSFSSSFSTSSNWSVQDYVGLSGCYVPAKVGRYDMPCQVIYTNNSNAAVDIKVWKYAGDIEHLQSAFGYILLYDANKQLVGQSMFVGGFANAKFVGANDTVVTPKTIMSNSAPTKCNTTCGKGAFYIDGNSELFPTLYTNAGSNMWARVTPAVHRNALPTSTTEMSRIGEIWTKETATAGTYDVILGTYDANYNQVFLKLSGTVYTPTEETPTVTTTAATPEVTEDDTEETNG